MNTVRFERGIAGAARATGTTIVIDTFRAFTTAAVLMDRGVDRIYLVDALDEARRLARSTGALLCGEDGGRRPAGFDLSNSPVEAAQRADLVGSTIVQRTSAGTRSVVAAIRAGANPVYAASLVVASATSTVAGVKPPVTIVAAGLHGTEPTEEDDLTAAFIADTIAGRRPDPLTADTIRSCDRAVTLAQAPWANPGDPGLAADLDRFAFAMRAHTTRKGPIELRRVDIRRDGEAGE